MTHYDSPEAAYHAFFETFNREDAEAWADVMNYPHVRVSSRAAYRLFPTPQDYAERASWDRFKETGWVRSEGMDPVRTHESADVVHLAGGWSRYNAAGGVIHSNRVSYVTTRVDGSWGIQARFGVDSLEDGIPGKPSDPSAVAATDVVKRYFAAWDERDLAACASFGTYPLVRVGVGVVTVLPDEAAMEQALAAAPQARSISLEVRPVQIGTSGVNVAATLKNESGTAHGLFLVANRDGRWGIVGRSVIGG
jgi:hypothetical protein